VCSKQVSAARTFSTDSRISRKLSINCKTVIAYEDTEASPPTGYGYFGLEGRCSVLTVLAAGVRFAAGVLRDSRQLRGCQWGGGAPGAGGGEAAQPAAEGVLHQSQTGATAEPSFAIASGGPGPFLRSELLQAER
jgi:hypothetical protein